MAGSCLIAAKSSAALLVRLLLHLRPFSLVLTIQLTDKTVRVFDVDTGKETSKWEQHSNSVR